MLVKGINKKITITATTDRRACNVTAFIYLSYFFFLFLLFVGFNAEPQQIYLIQFDHESLKSLKDEALISLLCLITLHTPNAPCPW